MATGVEGRRDIRDVIAADTIDEEFDS